MVEHNHEPIISQELWDKVREYDDSVSKGKRDSSGNVALFSGMLYCQDCGYKMKKIWLNRKRATSVIPASIAHGFSIAFEIGFLRANNHSAGGSMFAQQTRHSAAWGVPIQNPPEALESVLSLI